MTADGTGASDQTETPTAEATEAEPFIVAIGSSAGGLEALSALVGSLPEECPATYVIAQHMSPQHKSLLTELLSRETRLKVETIQDGTKPLANHIYVGKPACDIVIRDGKLRLIRPDDKLSAPKPSADRLFISLAEEVGPRAVAVVLSGTGSDGAYGIQSVRGAGGVTIAQDLETAKFDGMPASAIESGFVDLVLSPSQIGTHLAEILSRPGDLSGFQSAKNDENPMSDILQIVLARTRVDFRDYKMSMIQRRLTRRMNALNIGEQEDYIAHCRANPSEIDALFKDFLISVTKFFRDVEEFDLLNDAIRKLVERREDRTIRVWISGCATGEEAYSIAMLLAEAQGGIDKLNKNRLQIFATDIDSSALAKARQGVYPASAADNIPDELFSTYFTHADDNITVARALREVILFSDHNVFQDPPFQRIDLVCCRNLLIYFNTSLQSKVLSRFHYSLNADGLLFLGKAEAVTVSEDLFRQSGPAHIFRKRAGASDEDGSRLRSISSMTRRQAGAKAESAATADPYRQSFEALARSVAPTALLVEDDGRIEKVFGDVSRYIALTETTTLKLNIGMLRGQLHQSARLAMSLALKAGVKRSSQPAPLETDPDTRVRIDAFPIDGPDAEVRRVLLAFEEQKATKTELAAFDQGDASTSDAVARRVRELENELHTTREALQQTVEELESSNEELQALNEEMQSANEELQATNEELETSNEELQSTNEELVTVNEELQVSGMELSKISDEQGAIFEQIGTPILIVDSALQISKASSEAVRFLGLERPLTQSHLSQIPLPEGFPVLSSLCLEALQTGETVVREIFSGLGSHTIRCAPFANQRGQFLGVTVLIAESKANSNLMDLVLNNSSQMRMMRDQKGQIVGISEASAASMGKTKGEVVGKLLTEVLSRETAEEVLRQDHEFLDTMKDAETAQYEVTPEGQPTFVLDVERHRFLADDLSEPLIFAEAVNTTEPELMREVIERAESLLKSFGGGRESGHIVVDLRTRKVAWSREGVARLRPQDFRKTMDDLLAWIDVEDREEVRELFDKATADGGSFDIMANVVEVDGSPSRVALSGAVRSNVAGVKQFLIVAYTDVGPYRGKSL